MRTTLWLLLVAACSGGGDDSKNTDTDSPDGDADTDTDTDTDSDTDADTDTDSDADTDVTPTGSTGTTDTGPVPWGLTTCPPTPPQDAFTVLSTSIIGNVLRIDVQYSGGCAPHQMGVCWDAKWTPGKPLGLGGIAFHNANGDMCEGLVQDQIFVDLMPVRSQYTAETGQAFGTIQLDITNVGQIPYTF